jgi:hypothetical protein
MNLRTMVASKNVRGGKKAPLILSQSLEIPPSDPGALTSMMVDTSQSTFNPLSAAGTIKVAHSSTSVGTGGYGNTGYGGVSVPSLGAGQVEDAQMLYRGSSALSERSTLSIDTGRPLGSSGVPGITPSHAIQQARTRSREEAMSQGVPRTISREDSFFLNASDFLAAAPINYELSSRSLMQSESILEMTRALGGDDSSVGSSKTFGNKVIKRKATKLQRIPQAATAAPSGQYQHVHTEDQIPQWGSLHGPPTGGSRVDHNVVLGISGVNSIGGHTAKVYGTRGEFGANSGNATSTLAAAGSSLLRTANKAPSKGLELAVGLPEVKVQSYNVPVQKQNIFAGGAGSVSQRQQLSGVNEGVYMQSGPNSRGSVNGGNGLGATSPGDGIPLMLDSPSLGGSSAYPGFDFDRDRKHPARIAGELPPSQELVNGIVYNHRNNFAPANRNDDPYAIYHGEDSTMMHSASQGTVAASQATKANAAKLSQKLSAGHGVDSASGAVSGVSEEILGRLRKELLSR